MNTTKTNEIIWSVILLLKFGYLVVLNIKLFSNFTIEIPLFLTIFQLIHLLYKEYNTNH